MRQSNISAIIIGVLCSVGLLSLTGCGDLSQPAPVPSAYHVLAQWKVGGDGRWDYLTVDPRARRLYISRTDHVLVLDESSGSVVGQVNDTPGVHGIALAPDRGFTSNGTEGTLTVFDLKSLKVLGKVQAGQNPDAILYDPASRRVFAFNGRSHDLTAVDADVAVGLGVRPASTEPPVDLGGKPEFATTDGNGNIYVNIEDTSEVVRIDSRTLKVTARWPLAPGEQPSGMAIDAKNRRLFVGCHNQMMMILDADSGAVLATPPIGPGVDANAFDPLYDLAFSSNGGDGTLTIVQEKTPETFAVLQSLPTLPGARTMALDPLTHRIYLVTAQFGPMPAPTEEHPHPRPDILPGTFTVLVVGP